MDYRPHRNDVRVQLLIWLTKAPFLLLMWAVKRVGVTSNKTSNKIVKKGKLLRK